MLLDTSLDPYVTLVKGDILSHLLEQHRLGEWRMDQKAFRKTVASRWSAAHREALPQAMAQLVAEGSVRVETDCVRLTPMGSKRWTERA